MLKKLLQIVVVVLLTSNSYADVDETGTITRIIVEGSSIVSVWLSGIDITSECSGGTRWTIQNSDPMFKEKVSALLSAAAAGNTVHLFHLTSFGCGNWDSNKIYYVDVTY